jgi:hypothetical protein
VSSWLDGCRKDYQPHNPPVPSTNRTSADESHASHAHQAYHAKTNPPTQPPSFSKQRLNISYTFVPRNAHNATTWDRSGPGSRHSPPRRWHANATLTTVLPVHIDGTHVIGCVSPLSYT